MFSKIRDIIVAVLDFFYPLFQRIMPRHTFRYLACGGGNTLLDIALYYTSYHYILHEQELDFGLFGISAHIMAFIMGFAVTFPLGFTLSKYVVFPDSQLMGKVQFFRYAVLVAVVLTLNYVLIKLFVEVLHIYPTVAKVISTIIVAIFSYISQRNFSFKAAK